MLAPPLSESLSAVKLMRHGPPIQRARTAFSPCNRRVGFRNSHYCPVKASCLLLFFFTCPHSPPLPLPRPPPSHLPAPWPRGSGVPQRQRVAALQHARGRCLCLLLRWQRGGLRHCQVLHLAALALTGRSPAGLTDWLPAYPLPPAAQNVAAWADGCCCCCCCCHCRC